MSKNDHDQDQQAFLEEIDKMNCLDFKRLALSVPNSTEASFIEHSQSCPPCLSYVASVREMDKGLASSLEVEMPKDLVARLQLNQEISSQGTTRPRRQYAIAASLAVLLIAAFMIVNQFSVNCHIDQDYQTLLAGVVEHMDEQPITPVWTPERATQNANTLLASYDGKLHFRSMDNLQFSRICPMGIYRGLHASLETVDGQVTFAYIKGTPVGELLNVGYKGYISRVKPVRGGNLVIISRTQRSLEQADTQLANAMYWDI